MTAPCRVWFKFTIKLTSSDESYNLRIQDMPKDCFNEFCSLFNNYFSTEETMHKAAGIPNNAEALTEMNTMVRNMLTTPHHLAICCFDKGDPDTVGEIIGASIMKVFSKDESKDDFKPKTKEVAKLFELMDDLYNMLNHIEESNWDSFYDDRGVVVHPSYRGLGIGQNLLHARRVICKDAGISMTGAWMTCFATQKACERDGWETIHEVSYEEFGKKHGLTFEGVPPTCKYMVVRCNDN